MGQSKLGKGLSALMDEEYSGSSETEENSSGLKQVHINDIKAGKYQPRNDFKDVEMAELTASIAQSGVMQPILLRELGEGSSKKYEIIAGERRWRASQRAGLDNIPAMIKEMTDQQALELALVENIQREDLTALEEATGYQRLIEEFNYTQDALASVIGKSRSHIANLLRLLSLPEEIKQLLEDGKLSMGHARALMTADNAVALANQVVDRNLNVRQTEKLAKDGLSNSGKSTKSKQSSSRPNSNRETIQKNEDVIALEATLSEATGLKVEINDFGHQQGEIILSYESLEELDAILRRIGDAV